MKVTTYTDKPTTVWAVTQNFVYEATIKYSHAITPIENSVMVESVLCGEENPYICIHKGTSAFIGLYTNKDGVAKTLLRLNLDGVATPIAYFFLPNVVRFIDIVGEN